jgi:hypothetical protein
MLLFKERTMPKLNKTTQKQPSDIALPVALLRETITYLESQSDPTAVILKQRHKYWLTVLTQQLMQQNSK